MSDLEKYIEERKKRSPKFAKGYEEGYKLFEIGVLIQQAREAAGISQKELAERINTKRSAISRTENHAEDIKLSTLEKIATALDMKLQIKLVKHHA